MISILAFVLGDDSTQNTKAPADDEVPKSGPKKAWNMRQTPIPVAPFYKFFFTLFACALPQ